MRDKISFEINVPQIVTLQYPEGKLCEGRFGQQVMYSLSENQIMYLDLAVSQQINMLEPAVGESFAICKRSSKRWDVWLSPETEKFRAMRENPGAAISIPAQDPPSQLERELDESLRQIQERRANLPTRRPPASAPPASQPLGTGTNGPVAVPVRQHVAPVKATYQTAMTEFLLIAGRATRSAEMTLGAEGGSVRFDSRDVAALATTAFIQAARDGTIIPWRPGQVAL